MSGFEPTPVTAWRLTEPDAAPITIEGLASDLALPLRELLDSIAALAVTTDKWPTRAQAAIDSIARVLASPGVRWVEGDAEYGRTPAPKLALLLADAFVAGRVCRDRAAEFARDGVTNVSVSAMGDACQRCAKHDGRKRKLAGAPILPIHPGCRCVLLAED